MATNQLQQDNLFKAFGLFIEAFRPYAVSTLMKEAGDKWPAWFVDALYPAQRETWNMGIKVGTLPEALIDYPYLKSISHSNELLPGFRVTPHMDIKQGHLMELNYLSYQVH